MNGYKACIRVAKQGHNTNGIISHHGMGLVLQYKLDGLVIIVGRRKLRLRHYGLYECLAGGAFQSRYPGRRAVHLCGIRDIGDGFSFGQKSLA